MEEFNNIFPSKQAPSFSSALGLNRFLPSKQGPSFIAALTLLTFLLILIAAATTFAFTYSTPLTVRDLNNEESLAAQPDPLHPYPIRFINGIETWSVALQSNTLALNWFSNSTSYTVWDSFNGICGSRSAHYAVLSRTTWWLALSNSGFVPPFPNSCTRLSVTPSYALPSGNVVRFNLNLYAGFLRIETDLSNQFGAWNNFQGIRASLPTLPLDVTNWPQGKGAQILWQLRNTSNTQVVQFRDNGNLSVVNPSDPFGTTNAGTTNWYASTYIPLRC